MSEPMVATDGPRRSLPRRVLGTVARNGTVRKLVISAPLVRDVAWRFVAGEDLAAGIAAVRTLNERGVRGSLSYVGTHVRDELVALASADEVIAAIRAIRESALDSTLSLKLTQIGLDIDLELCRRQLRRILDVAVEANVLVRIDMEESPYVDQTIELFEDARDAYGAERVGIVVQSYLRDRQGDLDRLMAGGSRIRLVKGGYWESPDIVLKAKEGVDRAFFADIERLLRGGIQPAIATHDPAAVETAARVAREIGLDCEAFEFQMLLGVRPDLLERIVRDGHAVRCYVPYGGDWYAYVLGCLRRLPVGALQRIRRTASPARAGRATARGWSVGLALKRAMDVVGALAGIIVLSPVLAWTALAVMATMGRPILFRQERPGRDGRIFTIVKFRTMRQRLPDEPLIGTDAVRVTRLGRFLRLTSLDELPELWNVLRGDMSLVGPRPLLTEYLPRYTAREARRHEMRPGITGWAAVSGRHTLRFEDRLELDVWYVDHWSLRLDLRILGLTIAQVLGHHNVSSTQNLEAIAFPDRFMVGLTGDAHDGADAPASDAGPTHDPNGPVAPAP